MLNFHQFSRQFFSHLMFLTFSGLLLHYFLSLGKNICLPDESTGQHKKKSQNFEHRYNATLRERFNVHLFFSRQELLVQTWKWLRMVGLLFLAEGLVIAKQYSQTCEKAALCTAQVRLLLLDSFIKFAFCQCNLVRKCNSSEYIAYFRY